MILHIDYQTLDFMLDLPSDLAIVGVESDGEGFVRFNVSGADDYGTATVSPVYAPDDSGNVGLVGFTEDLPS